MVDFFLKNVLNCGWGISIVQNEREKRKNSEMRGSNYKHKTILKLASLLEAAEVVAIQYSMMFFYLQE